MYGRYAEREGWKATAGRCRLTLSNPVLKAPMVQRLKLKYDEPPSNFAFKFNLRRYTTVLSYNAGESGGFKEIVVGRCRFTLTNPR